MPGRRYFTRDRDGVRVANVHVYRDGDHDVERHLAFCAYLREHESVRDAYERMKRGIHAAHPTDITAYTEGKAEWIRSIEPIAREWYRRQRAQQQPIADGEPHLLEFPPGATI